MKGKKGPTLIIFLLFASLFLIRLVHLSADPPYNLSSSGGPYGDPGGYSFNARNRVLFGTWEVDDYNMMYLSFPPHLFTYLIFRFFGVGIAQQNLVPVFFSWGSLVVFFLLLKSRFSRGLALAGTALLGLNYLFLMFSRIANRVMPPIFFLLLGILFLQKGTRKRGWFCAAGASFFLALVSKSVIFYILAAAGAAYLFFALSRYSIRSVAGQAGLLSVGALVPGLPWFLFLYLPHQEFIRSFSQLNVKYLIPPADFSLLLRYFWVRPALLLQQMPLLSVLAAVASLFLLEKVSRQGRSTPLVDWVFLFWFFTGFLYYAVIQQRVTRHFIPHIVPLVFLAVLLLSLLTGREERLRKRPPLFFALLLFLWMLFPVSLLLKTASERFPSLLKTQGALNLSLLLFSGMAAGLTFFLFTSFPRGKGNPGVRKAGKAVAALFLVGVFAIQGAKYAAWAVHPFYQFKEISRDLGRAFSRATLAGLWAPVACLENRHRAHEYYPGIINDYPDFFQRFGITHVFTTTAFGEDRIFRRNFPRIMEGATLIARYHIWTVEVLLYDIQPPKIDEGPRFEAELHTLKGNTPRFDSRASGRFAVLCRARRAQPVVEIPSGRELPKGIYRVFFRLKAPGRRGKEDASLARLEVISASRNRGLAFRLVQAGEIPKEDYREVALTFRLKTSERVSFRVVSRGNGSFWVDKVDLRRGE